MDINITNGNQQTLTATFKDAAGDPVAAPGPVTWVSTNTDVGTITPSSDGLSAVFKTVGLGATHVNTTSGSLSNMVTYTVVAGPASQIIVTPGPVTPIP